jgi:hypothetical protein
MNNDTKDHEEEEGNNLRGYLKIVRDPTKTAFDILPDGQTIGEFANKQAVERYSKKIVNKRIRASKQRRRKREQNKKTVRNNIQKQNANV